MRDLTDGGMTEGGALRSKLAVWQVVGSEAPPPPDVTGGLKKHQKL